MVWPERDWYTSLVQHFVWFRVWLCRLCFGEVKSVIAVEFKTSLVNTVSARSARATQWDAIPKQTNNCVMGETHKHFCYQIILAILRKWENHSCNWVTNLTMSFFHGTSFLLIKNYINCLDLGVWQIVSWKWKKWAWKTAVNICCQWSYLSCQMKSRSLEKVGVCHSELDSLYSTLHAMLAVMSVKFRSCIMSTFGNAEWLNGIFSKYLFME